MRDRFKEWCETSDISIDEIDGRASKAVENGEYPTMVFISLDLYAELQKSFYSMTKYGAQNSLLTSQNIMSINTTAAGSLNVQQVRRLRNFLMIGRKEDMEAFTHAGVDPMFWNDQERVRVDKAFEDLLILEGEGNDG